MTKPRVYWIIVGLALLVMLASKGYFNMNQPTLPTALVSNVPPMQLSPDSIVLSHPADLGEEAWERVVDHTDDAEREECRARVAKWPKGWQRVYIIGILGSGFQPNHGFHEYFFYFDNDYITQTRETLSELGAVEYLPLYDDAVKVFEAHDYKKKERGNSTWGRDVTKAMQPGIDGKRFESQDAAFADLEKKKSLFAYLGEYIKAHPEEFTTAIDAGDSESEAQTQSQTQPQTQPTTQP